MMVPCSLVLLVPLLILGHFTHNTQHTTQNTEPELRSKVVEVVEVVKVVKVVFMLAAFNITSYINGRAGKDPIRLSNYKYLAIDGT